jgi:hypothetical protein
MSILVPCAALFALSGFFFWMARTTSRKHRKRPTRHEALTGATMGSKETKDGIVVLMGKREPE